jgi:hypothetical protein
VAMPTVVDKVSIIQAGHHTIKWLTILQLQQTSDYLAAVYLGCGLSVHDFSLFVDIFAIF